MNTIGIPELLIVLVVVLLLLGPKRLPALGRSIGGGLREFKASIRGRGEDSKLTSANRPPDAEPLEGEVVPEPPRR